MNRGLFFIGLLAILTMCTPSAELPQPPQQYTIEQFMDIVNVLGGSFSADEKSVLITSKATGVYNAFTVNIETGVQQQLTHSDEDAIFADSFFPKDDRIVYTSDQGGNELDHIYIRNTDGSNIDLTPDSAKAVLYQWNDARTALFWASNKRDPRFFDMYRTEVAGSEVENGVYNTTTVYENNNGFTPSTISDDERYMALQENITTSNSNIHLLDLNTGKTTLITEHEGSEGNSAQFFSNDNKKLFFTTNRDKEYAYLVSYDLQTGERKVEETADWDIVFSNLSLNGKYRVTGINNDARTEIRIWDTATGEKVSISNLPAGDVTGVNISDSETKMSFYLSSSKSPRNLFVYNFESGDLKQLTQSMTADINPDDLVEGEVIRYASFDGLEIPALLYKPKVIAPGEKLPAVLYIHGGPGGQSRLNYTPRIQYWVNHGYVVLAVNNRGSSGYGKSFFQADDLKHGDADLKDCIESKKFLIGTGYVDPDKIGIMGGSYGGYMVMAALAFAPEEFAVGVNYFGVTNWLRTLRSIPPWWESFREALYLELGNPFEDSLSLYNKSPLFFADQITKPFIVLQGANDPRVLQVESDDIVEAARANGVPVEYVIFPDEGHGFVKNENNITASRRSLEFLDKYLKGAD